MTPLLLAGIPFVLLGTVLLLGFVGCGLQTAGTLVTFDMQLGSHVPSLVSWWLLAEPSGPTAKDNKDGHNGTYVSAAVPANTAAQSAAAPGTLNFDAPSLISNQPARRSIDVNGGRVDIPFSADLNTDKFTMAGFVRTKWEASDPPAYRCVFVSAEADGAAFKGFALYANPSNHWEAWIGDGTGWHQATASGPISLGTTDYLAVTYDGTKLTLYVNIEERGSVNAPFKKTTSGPMRIGQATPALFPFVGQIEDVFYCNDALDHQKIADIGYSSIG